MELHCACCDEIVTEQETYLGLCASCLRKRFRLDDSKLESIQKKRRFDDE